MTSPAELFAQADALFLDFDGPVAALMPPPVNAQAADHARTALAGIDLPPEIGETTDHLAVLRYAIDEVPSRVLAVEAACTAAELDASRMCRPSPQALKLLTAAASRGMPVAVVSNNGDAAVRLFFELHGWTDYVSVFACRLPETAAWLKPSPRLLWLAADALKVDVASVLFVGDSVSDVVAGKSVGAAVLAMAKDEQRQRELLDAGAAEVVGPGEAIRLGR